MCSSLSYIIGNDPEGVSQANVLGVTISSQFSCNAHLDVICSKVKQRMRRDPLKFASELDRFSIIHWHSHVVYGDYYNISSVKLL